jgi:hypothetical protein
LLRLLQFHRLLIMWKLKWMMILWYSRLLGKTGVLGLARFPGIPTYVNKDDDLLAYSRLLREAHVCWDLMGSVCSRGGCCISETCVSTDFLWGGPSELFGGGGCAMSTKLQF